VEGGGKLIDGTYFNYKTNAKWVSLNGPKLELKNITWKKDTFASAGVNIGDEEILFTMPDIPYITFYGTVPDKNGGFAITRAHFLAGNYGGWNEFDVAVGGSGRALLSPDGGVVFSVFNTIKLYNIIDGKIRRDNTRLTGERAAVELSNRNERINFLVNWMRRERGIASERGGDDGAVPKFDNQKEFEAYWTQVLFAKSEKFTMPEELDEMRENGALEADWNEASSWIYVYYDWNKITSVLNREAVLKRTKN
jgi:hypothetical protein